MANTIPKRQVVIFDTATKSISPVWLAEYKVKTLCTDDEAIQAANEALRTMLPLFALLDTNPQATEAGRMQLLDLKRDIEDYLRAVDLLKKIRTEDYRKMITKGDPSLFATEGSVTGVRLWGMSFADREGVSHVHLQTLFTFIVYSLKALPLEDLSPKTIIPQIQSVVPGIPSMEWVIDYRWRNKASFEDAHKEGVKRLMELEGKGTLSA
jgi:hypothetical protein